MPLKVVKSGLVAHYRSNNGGLIMPDISRYGTNVTLVGSYDRRSHAKGFAVTFPGTSAQSGTGALHKSWNAVDDVSKISLFAWVYWTASTESYNTVIEKWVDPRGYTLMIKSTGKLATYVYNVTGLAADGTGTATLAVNQWYYIGFTYDGANLKNYVNGVLDATTSGSTTIGATSASTFKIGYSIFGAGRYFRGSIDDVTIYNRALTAVEIQQNYIATKR
jgi:hypothetical protein